MKFGEILRKIREEKGMDEKAAALYFGITKEDYRKYESSTSRPSIERAGMMLKTAGIRLQCVQPDGKVMELG